VGRQPGADVGQPDVGQPDVGRQLAAAADPPAQAADALDPVELRADLRARIRRAEAELASGNPTCSCCAQPLSRAALEAHVTTWRRELADIDVRAAEAEARAAARAERARLEATLAQAQRAVDAAQTARAKVVDTLTRVLGDGVDARAELAKRTHALQDARVAHAAEGAKAEALLAAAEDALADVEDRIERHTSRAARLEREEARLATVLDVLEKRRARGEELRALAAAFKQLQEELRTSAAAELSAETLRIHRALSVDDELADLRIDPARYQVFVRARDHDAEAPASLVQGGGHRLLLGLAFRLALVARLGPFPFVLLDEPTYGLDERHRAALLERITRLGLTTQILLITHQAMGDAADGRVQQIRIERAPAESAA
jgi:DNA repair exonuclease SbcCD ATPase subunit